MPYRDVLAAALFLALPIATALVGCGGESTYGVSGVVTSRNEPVPQARVAFYDASGAIAGMADTDATGEFVFPDGLPPGSYDVAVFSIAGSGTPPPDVDGVLPPVGFELSAPPPFPEKYLSPGTSSLRREVVADRDNRFELRLD